MALAPSTRLGPYEVVSLLGEGGMGQVYRARDTKLNRDVALKILSDAFTLNDDRIARFRREAQVLASLNHPNIAAIYGFEDSGSTHALVLELVDGPTLADRIAKGRIPLDEALAIAKQIAEALEAAHEQGIIHRDLKPANIKVRSDGTVKVLDFGLAKAMEPASASTSSLTVSPTITSPAVMTGVGMLLGTAAYMSPEQAKGRAADKRSDIWAFGCVLYEMLAGRRAFDGDDVSDTLAAILRGEPDWTGVPLNVEASTRAMLDGCLKKDRRERIGDVSTLLFLLKAPTSVFSPTAAPRTAQPRWRRGGVLLAIALVVAGIGLAAGRFRRSSPVIQPPVVARLSFMLPAEQQFTENGGRIIAISPDGTQMAYVANRRLYLRPLSEGEARPISGTEVSEGLIAHPAFSPDGRSIAFWSGDGPTASLKKISVTGGTAVTLLRTTRLSGITWTGDAIVFAQDGKRILRISENGGEPEVLVTLKAGVLMGPQLLPGGDAVLFSVARNADTVLGATLDDWDKADIVIQSLKSAEVTTVIRGGLDAHYLPTGHIVFTTGSTLFAVLFDLQRRQTTGSRVPLVEDVRRPALAGGVQGVVHATVSDAGTLMYVPADATTYLSDMAIVDRSGHPDPLNLQPGVFRVPRISPEGKRLVIERDDGVGTSLWMYDMSGTDSLRQLTFGNSRSRYPVWSSDGKRIAFQTDRDGDRAIFTMVADDPGSVERLTTPEKGTEHIPEDWSHDGKTLLFAVADQGTFSLHALSLDAHRVTPVAGVRSRGYATGAKFSPDDRWIAYGSNPDEKEPTPSTLGRDLPSVWVRRFTDGRQPYFIARGLHPLWSPDGKELFYHRLPDMPEHMEVVSVTTRPSEASFAFARPTAVPMNGVRFGPPGGESNLDALPDDKRFVAVLMPSATRGGSARVAQINVVLNWTEELKRRVPLK